MYATKINAQKCTIVTSKVEAIKKAYMDFVFHVITLCLLYPVEVSKIGTKSYSALAMLTTEKI